MKAWLRRNVTWIAITVALSVIAALATTLVMFDKNVGTIRSNQAKIEKAETEIEADERKIAVLYRDNLRFWHGDCLFQKRKAAESYALGQTFEKAYRKNGPGKEEWKQLAVQFKQYGYDFQTSFPERCDGTPRPSTDDKAKV